MLSSTSACKFSAEFRSNPTAPSTVRSVSQLFRIPHHNTSYKRTHFNTAHACSVCQCYGNKHRIGLHFVHQSMNQSVSQSVNPSSWQCVKHKTNCSKGPVLHIFSARRRGADSLRIQRLARLIKTMQIPLKTRNNVLAIFRRRPLHISMYVFHLSGGCKLKPLLLAKL